MNAQLSRIVYTVEMATLIKYKKALLKYTPLEQFQAGLELMGAEVKSLRGNLGSLDGAHVVVRGGEAYLIGMTIPPYQVKNTPKSYEPDRPRRLLLKRKEVAILLDAESKKGLTIVPLEIYSPTGNGRFLKASVAIVRGKNKVDKREDIKRKDTDRERARLLKSS